MHNSHWATLANTVEYFIVLDSLGFEDDIYLKKYKDILAIVGK